MTPDLSVQFACRLAVMIESRLICFKHLQPWADETITSLDEPPVWVLKLSTATYIGDVQGAVLEYINSDSALPQRRGPRAYADEYVACLFLRHRRGELSWATFLEQAGQKTDANDSRCDCEFFYIMLNELEDAEFYYDLERGQLSAIEREFGDVIASVERTYLPFLRYFRDAIRRRQG